MNILITGGNGFIGTALTDHLITAGHTITIMGRRAPDRLVDFVKCDMLADEVSPEMLAGQEAIIHLVGTPVFTRWTKSKKQMMWRSRIETAQKLIDAILAMPISKRPKVVVSASGSGYYGEKGEAVLGEDATAGTGYLAQICVAWEAVWAPLEDVGIRVVQLRTGVVIGPGGGIMGALLPVYNLGLGPIIGTGTEYFSWVSMNDLVRMYEFALNTKTLFGPVNAVSPNPVTTKEFAKTIGRVVHRPVFVPSPIWLMDVVLNGAAKDGFSSARVLPSKLEVLSFEYKSPTLEQSIRSSL